MDFRDQIADISASLQSLKSEKPTPRDMKPLRGFLNSLVVANLCLRCMLYDEGPEDEPPEIGLQEPLE
jgi:hypothetical protein